VLLVHPKEAAFIVVIIALSVAYSQALSLYLIARA